MNREPVEKLKIREIYLSWLTENSLKDLRSNLFIIEVDVNVANSLQKTKKTIKFLEKEMKIYALLLSSMGCNWMASPSFFLRRRPQDKSAIKFRVPK